MGNILCVVLRIPALILEKVLRRDHSMPPKRPPQFIVVAKYLGIGSIVQATPMLKGLKEKYPSTKIVFLSLATNKGLLSRYDFVDEVVCVDDSSLVRVVTSSILALLYLARKKIDLFIDLEVYSTYGSIMCLLSLAKNRLGFSVEDADFKSFMYTHLLYLNKGFPMRYCYNQIGELAGMDPPSGLAEPLCPSLSHADLELVQAKVHEVFDFEYRGIIALNINASDLRFERRWTRQGFAEVAREFSKKGYAIALVGSRAEREYVQGVIDHLAKDAKHVRNLAGSFSLIEFFAFLRQCCLVVTNDSGVMNMALTLPVPQLLLAGPVDPEQYFIPNDFRTYIYYQTYCSPCTHYVDTPPCAGNNVCMQQIRPGNVIEISERLLAGEYVAPQRSLSLTYKSEVLGVLRDKGKS